MFRRLVGIALPTLFVFCAAAPAYAATIIYFDGAGGAPGGPIAANMTLNLVGHFDRTVQTAPVDQYHGGDMAHFQHVIYLGTASNTLPPPFLADAAAGVQPLLWVGGNASQLFGVAGPKFGFTGGNWFDGTGWSTISYKSRTLNRISIDLFPATVVGQAHVWATVANGKQSMPYILSGGTLFYCTEIPYFNQAEDDVYNVFSDILHEFYETGVGDAKVAMLRLEDLAPNPNHVPADVFTEVMDGLTERQIPFGFGLVPIYKDPEGEYYPAGSEFRLSQSPTFIEQIKTMLRSGGTPIEHGVTHQHDQQTSLVGWEFVEDAGNAPLPCDSAAWVEDRLKMGGAEFADAVLPLPKIWETPHYGASHGDYLDIGIHFGVCWEHPLVFPLPADHPPVFETNLSPQPQIIPYFTPVGSSGMAILPETLDYIDPTNPAQTPAAILAHAERLSVVRDGVAAFYYHMGQISPDLLWQVVDGLTAAGYKFASPSEVAGEDLEVAAPPDDDASGHAPAAGHHGGGCGS